MKVFQLCNSKSKLQLSVFQSWRAPSFYSLSPPLLPGLLATPGCRTKRPQLPEQLPGPTHRSSVVQMDYGERQLELHSGLLPRSSHPGTAGNRVAVIDDVLATGGSLLACVEVLRQLGVAVVEAACVYDLHLGGKAALAEVGVPAFCLANFREDGNREWWLERGTEEEAAATVSPHMGKRLKQAIKP